LVKVIEKGITNATNEKTVSRGTLWLIKRSSISLKTFPRTSTRLNKATPMAVATQSAVRKYRSRIFKMIKTIQETLKNSKETEKIAPDDARMQERERKRNKGGCFHCG